MSNIRIAVIVIIAVWCSAAVADVSPPWFTAEGALDQSLTFSPVTPAPWAIEVSSGAFRITPDWFPNPFRGAGTRYVIQEVGARAELRVHVLDFPRHYMEGSPILRLFANGSAIAEVAIVSDGISEAVEARVGGVSVSRPPVRWLGIALAWPWVAVLASADGQNWEPIADSILSVVGPYHMALGITDCAGGALQVPVNYDTVIIGLEPVATEGASWGRVKSLFR